MHSKNLTDLAEARYLNLATFRKNGVAVRTPVWFAADDGVLYVFSAGEAGKVKRLRNSSRAEVAPCTYSGTVTGPWYPASARLIDSADEINRAYRALRRKYGWQMRSLDLFSRLGRQYHRRAFIAITPDPVSV